jgi:hypothetical protein
VQARGEDGESGGDPRHRAADARKPRVALAAIVRGAGRSAAARASAASGLVGGSKPVRIAFANLHRRCDGLQLVGVSMSDLLHARLAEIPEVIVRAPEYSAHAGLRAASLVEFARRAGVPNVVTGTLERRPARKGYLTLTLHQVDQPAHLRDVPLGGYDIRFLAASTDLASFLKTRDAIVDRIVDLLLPAIDARRADRNAPASAEAYRLCPAGWRPIRAAGHVRRDGARLVQQSLALDPAYAPAWLLLGWAHYNEVGACGQEGSHYDRALEAARKAGGLAPGLPEPTALTAAVLTETGRVEEAYDLLLRARARFPAAPGIRYAMAYALTYAGFLDRAAGQLDELIQLDPMYLTSAGWTPNAFLYRRQWDRFLSLPRNRGAALPLLPRLRQFQNGRLGAAKTRSNPRSA